MMKSIFTVFIVLISLHINAQKVKLIKLNDLEKRISNGKDTFYVVNYWATWCAPCIKELPYFDQLQKAHKDKPVKVLLVSLDFPSRYKKKVVPFIEKRKLTSEVFLLDETDQQAYIDRISPQWSGALPATAFINRAKNTTQFFEQEFTYKELLATFNSLQ
jgi:thiol-disulfide isomerase/thioredoxin